ncbi:hypothetical protein KY495_13910 [Massilia sp. PAMC28688]|uniref:hypothetical protein n=1 Tax=Massilia sp. PAMC28688 TaxID=2861283 RepID=UPI001C637802|nr:hypothetical protein [Massilia sp. PAMC28688]QYF91880.1 hypothetical protein KY495_13910 [Massilia sp. PAMC28688]
MTQNHAFDNSIPVLTEVFTDEPEPAPPPAPVKAEAPRQLPVQDVLTGALEARAIDSWSEPEWNLLERRLSERILQQLQGRVDFVLEQRLRDSMEEVLTHAIAGLTSEIRVGLQATIEKIVVRAVAQEVAHLQALKK